MTFILLLTIQVLLPLMFTVWLYHTKPSSRFNWLLQTIFTGSLILFTWTLGPQAWTSIFIGLALVIFYLVGSVKSFMNTPKGWNSFEFGEGWDEILFTVTQIFVSIIFIPLALYGMSGYSYDNDDPLSLRFPLQNGLYIVGHGGSNPLINYHNVSESQRYALDVSKVNAIGTRAYGAHPSELDRYAIFGDNLYSPCDGKVMGVETGYEDMNPPERGDGHPAGNHIVINCDGVDVTIAHMMHNSVTVDSADVLAVGELIGKVGNSGNTSEPHLHIHADKDGTGVPILFKNRFLVRNSLIWR